MVNAQWTISRKEVVAVVVGTLLFLVLQGWLVGFMPAQVFMALLFLTLYFAHPSSRRLAVALLPFVVFEISYDWMRLYPNYQVNPIDTKGIYNAELQLFGISANGVTMIPGQYFNLHHTTLADFLAGLSYLCWVPGPMAFGLWLYFKGERCWYLRFALCFLLINFIGFAGYYIHPAAPPWYVLEYGFEPVLNTPGNVAGLARFDELVGLPVFHSIYVNNSNVFAAVPSLHAAYMLVATAYSAMSRQRWPLTALCALITIGIWCTAVYSCHHYTIDVLLGIATAIAGILIFELGLMRWKPFRRFIDSYCAYCSNSVPGGNSAGNSAGNSTSTSASTSAGSQHRHGVCRFCQHDHATPPHTLLILLLLLPSPTPCPAQTTIKAETQLSLSDGEHTPLWLNANKYGLSSLSTTNGYLRASAQKPVKADSASRWSWGFTADVAVAAGYTSTVVLQQAFAEVRWLKGLLTVGSKEQPMELKNQQLSTGSQTFGINARPMPMVRLSLPNYWDVPLTRHWLGVKGHIAYGMQTDGRWQQHFTNKSHRYTRHTKLHTKAGYLRFGREGSWFTAEAGMEMACQYGGTAYIDSPDGLVKIDNEDGIQGAWRALIPGGSEVGEGIYKNKGGNHVGSYLLRLNLNQKHWKLSAYADHYFDDHSQMFFLDYDGYGQGERYNEWEHSRWLLYGLHDIMLGLELQLKRTPYISNIVVEYLYTKYQSGPIFHDRTLQLSDHIGGRDNYYNHHIATGWQHWGQVIGNPLYRSPLYNHDGTIRVTNNRFWAWHAAVSGQPTPRLAYRLLCTWQRGWGTYDAPLPNPQHNVSLLAEAQYRLSTSARRHSPQWTLRAAWAMDRGGLIGNNMGLQLTAACAVGVGE